MESAGFGRAFSGDPAAAPEELIQFLDRCRQLAPIVEAKQWLLDELRLVAGQSVLDVGCGTGDDVAAMAELVGQAGRALGVDSSEAMITEATGRHGALPGVSFHVGDAGQLPFESESLDACRVERVLQHLPDPDGAVAEMARVLKPGGRLALMDADWESLLIEGADPVLSGQIWRNSFAGVRQPRVGRRLLALLLQNGFVEISFEGAAAVATDLDRAMRQLGFAQAASQAVESGLVSEEEATRWVDDLEEAARAGRFFHAFLTFRASGHKA